MPWSSADVSGKTKKASTPKAKRQWVHVANSMLAGGASEKTAIMAANSVAKKAAAKRQRRFGALA